jgi:hypothetical protein
VKDELHALRVRMYQAEALAARSDAVLEAARLVSDNPTDGAALTKLREALAAFDAAKKRLHPS